MNAVPNPLVSPLNRPLLIAAFTGWPDSGEVASATGRYLLRKLRSRRFAAIDPESYYDFTQQRPHVESAQDDSQTVNWSPGEFWAARSAHGGRDVVIFIGPEPQLRWRTYTREFVAIAQQAGVTEVAVLGCVYDNVPHTGDAKISGVSPVPNLLRRLTEAGLTADDNQGAASVHAVLLETCAAAGIAAASIWGHAPHYVQAIPNWKVCYTILQKLHQLFGVRVDLDEIRAAGRTVERRIERTLARDPDLRAYVQQIQEQAGSFSSTPSAVAPAWDIDDVLREAEAVLWPSRPENSGPAAGA